MRRKLFLLVGLLFVSYTAVMAWKQRDVICATEVRVYASGTKKMRLHLRGRAAQNAANYFIFRDGSMCDGSLLMDIENQVTVEFWDGNQKKRIVSFGLNDGQTDVTGRMCNKYLTNDSRRYWEQLVKGRH